MIWFYQRGGKRRFAELQAALQREGWGPLERRPIESGFPHQRVGRGALVC
jgi:hypothetical protein